MINFKHSYFLYTIFACNMMTINIMSMPSSRIINHQLHNQMKKFSEENPIRFAESQQELLNKNNKFNQFEVQNNILTKRIKNLKLKEKELIDVKKNKMSTIHSIIPFAAKNIYQQRKLNSIQKNEEAILNRLQNSSTPFYKAPEDISKIEHPISQYNQLEKNKNGVIFEFTVSPDLTKIPDNFTSPKSIVLYYVPGTWTNAENYINKHKPSDMSDEFTEANFAQHPFTSSLQIFAQKLANDKKTSVCVKLFKWDAHATEQARKKAGNDLATDILQNNAHAEIWTIGHSHGGNVINHAAQNKAHIDTAVFFGTPVLDVGPAKNKKYNIDNLVNLYSNADGIGTAGSALTSIWTGNFSATLLKDRSLDQNERVINIGIKKDGKDLDHAGVKKVGLEYLASILHKAHTDFVLNSDIVCNIDTQLNEYGKATIQGAISNRDPLKSIHGSMLSPGFTAILEKAKQQSDKTEQDFTNTYNGSSIHDHASATAILLQESNRKLGSLVEPIINKFEKKSSPKNGTKEEKNQHFDDNCDYDDEDNFLKPNHTVNAGIEQKEDLN